MHQRRPVQTVRCQRNPHAGSATKLLHVGLERCRILDDGDAPVLAKVEHVELVERGRYIVWVHPRVSGHRPNTESRRRAVIQILHEDALPVAVVADAAEVGQGFLWRARLALDTGEEVAEVDEEAAVALTLVLGHCHDAGHVVLLLARLLFGEVADKMAALAVVLGQHVEEEGLDVVVERLVIEEELCQEAEVLAVDLTAHAVHLEDRKVGLAVDLVGGRVEPGALSAVSLENAAALHILEAEFAEEELW